MCKLQEKTLMFAQKCNCVVASRLYAFRKRSILVEFHRPFMSIKERNDIHICTIQNCGESHVKLFFVSTAWRFWSLDPFKHQFWSHRLGTTVACSPHGYSSKKPMGGRVERGLGIPVTGLKTQAWNPRHKSQALTTWPIVHWCGRCVLIDVAGKSLNFLLCPYRQYSCQSTCYSCIFAWRAYEAPSHSSSL